jgi:hypothetical protein
MFKLLIRSLTKNLTEVPLFTILLNYKKYKKDGKENSCIVKIHPIFNEDEILKGKIKDIIDYIRNNYDVDNII